MTIPTKRRTDRLLKGESSWKQERKVSEHVNHIEVPPDAIERDRMLPIPEIEDDVTKHSLG